MKYFRFNGKDDLWLGKYGKSERTLIPNELLTQKEVDRVKRDCPRLSIDKAFTVVELSPNNTYSSFGVRFQNDTDHNTKFESRRNIRRKLSVNEGYNYGTVADIKSMKNNLDSITCDFLEGDRDDIPELTISFNGKFIDIPMDWPELNNEFLYFLEGLIEAYNEIENG
jgi:hypothetical protein